ncbi:ras GTP exchange factor, son of sevenless-like protein, partial [Euroglyphus maynei]
MLQKDVLGHKTDIQVSQYLLAVLEFIATDILQLAGHYVRNMIHTEITSQDIHATMCADKVLMEIFYNDEEEDEGPPLSGNCYYSQSFFDADFGDNGEYGNVGNHTITYSEAVHEFIQEERQFIRELSLIIKVFRDPMTTVLSEDDLERIFVNIDDIYEFAVKFLSLLEDAVEVADEDDCPAIGSCFIEIAEDEEMDVFLKYAQNVMNFSFRDHLYYVLSQHSLQSRISEIFSSRYNAAANGMMAAIKYVLPRLILLPVYHCFSYFKAIEKLRELTPLVSDRENYEQADSSLQSVRNVLEKEKKLNKFGDGYFLRLYGRTHRATALAKMKEIQSSIDNWNGKDIWQSCNEFIREGLLYKVSNPGKAIGNLSNRGFPTERRAFLFDSLLVLCKHCNKRIVPGRGDNSHLEWRFKERFFIRNIEIIERDEPYVRSNFFLFSNSHSDNQNSILEQSSSLLSSSVSNISNHISSDNSNTIHAFEISQTNQNQSIVLMAKTVEEKDSWMSQLILLNMRSMLERTLDAKLLEEAKKHPLLLPHASVYRFAIEDMDSNIIFEENKSNRNVPLIKGATLLKLVERLTYHKYGDPNLVRIFLTTY